MKSFQAETKNAGHSGFSREMLAEKMEFYRQQLDENGYVVIEGLIDSIKCQNSIDAICDFMQVEQFDRHTWYKDAPLNSIGLVPMHQHPAFWAIRQDEVVYDAFSGLLDEEKLWVTMDRASFRPPCRYDLEKYGDDANYMHWDYDFRKSARNMFQGLIYLADTDATQGAFSCVPSVYKKIRAGEYEHFDQFDKFTKKGLFLSHAQEFSDKDIVPIAAPAGSLIIWDSRLPHGCVSNHSPMPRFVQFISMYPSGDSESSSAKIEDDRESRIQCFNDKRAPECHRGLNGQHDPERHERFELSELGRKLVGFDHWE
ncbi:phytanoyl-CoA dioxygenase family protein [Jeongeupia wiesaeckerbachi]|uniref:phytanoyl-CoA dioxygenase family protein n=1 Tax=Jeongeupia wiesaeckerbachi TaxID=3051218 RepID=UPI003D808732